MMKILNRIKAKIEARWSRKPNHQVIFDLVPGGVISIQGVDTGREYITLEIATPQVEHFHPAVRTVVEIGEDEKMRSISFVFPVDTAGPDPDPIRLEVIDVGEGRWVDGKE